MSSVLVGHARRIGATVALLVGAAGAARGQPVGGPPAGARPGAGVPHGLAGLPDRVPVRLATASGRVRGEFRGVAGDTVFVAASDGRVVATVLAAVDTLWARDERHTARGLRIGAVAGGVALGGFALFLSQVLCDGGGCASQAAGPTLAAAVLGAGGGAAVGGVLGMLVPRWRRVHP